MEIEQKKMEVACKGCEVTITVPSAGNAISRYGHGEICAHCGLREALDGDFIDQGADV